MEAPRIDYKAPGHLIASQHIERDLFIVLIHWRVGRTLPVQFGDEYVVSVYKNGSGEWLSGSYFSDILAAADNFHARGNV